jgi:hypothetical protein
MNTNKASANKTLSITLRKRNYQTLSIAESRRYKPVTIIFREKNKPGLSFFNPNTPRYP